MQISPPVNTEVRQGVAVWVVPSQNTLDREQSKSALRWGVSVCPADQQIVSEDTSLQERMQRNPLR